MTFDEYHERLYSGTTPEEFLAAKIADRAGVTPAGVRLPGGETAYPHERGKFQIRDDRHGVIAGDGVTYEPIWVGADDVLEVRLAYKDALVRAARELAS